MPAAQNQSGCQILTVSRLKGSWRMLVLNQPTCRLSCTFTFSRSSFVSSARSVISPFVRTPLSARKDAFSITLDADTRRCTEARVYIVLLPCFISCSPADVPAILDDPIVLEIAQGHGKSPAQVLLRHLIQQGVAVIPKSSSKHHIKENFQVKLISFDLVG